MRITNPVAVLGENAACKYLTSKGYTILERNFRKGYGEIDIIATYNNVLIFIEVKTRSSDTFGVPLEAITRRKLDTLIKGAQFYKYILHPDLPDDIRIDAVSVRVKGGSVIAIEHIESITQL